MSAANRIHDQPILRDGSPSMRAPDAVDQQRVDQQAEGERCHVSCERPAAVVAPKYVICMMQQPEDADRDRKPHERLRVREASTDHVLNSFLHCNIERSR